MSTQRRKDKRDAKAFRNSLRLTQLRVLAFLFSLSRWIFFLFEQHHVLWTYFEERKQRKFFFSTSFINAETLK